MAWNNSAMVDAANGIRATAIWAQLHSAAAGGSGTSNVCSGGRKAVSWASATGLGDFSLSAPIAFTGGAAGGTVYSVTFWTASTSGTLKGEFVLSGGSAFNGAGQFNLQTLSETGVAT